MRKVSCPGLSTPYFALFIHFIPTLLVFLIAAQTLHSQMVSVVNSTADDEFAVAYDFILTTEDESTDGICEDSLHRCTLRAAIDEAANLGLAADVIVEVSGTIMINPLKGAFSPPDLSILSAGAGSTVDIQGTPGDVIFNIGNGTSIYGFGLSNALYGILVGGNYNLIGTVTDNKNFITGMVHSGIFIAGDSNKIVGNIIGLDRGAQPQGSQYGIFNTGSGNIIGGGLPDQGNVISANHIGIGVYNIDGILSIQGNFIGTDISGTMARGNDVGIDVIGPATDIGGDDPGEMNVISGNNESGVLIGIQGIGNFVRGNHIGVDQSGNLIIPNRDGIILGPGSEGCNVESNLIKGNSQFGIAISGLMDSALASFDHIILDNEILMNTQAGIMISGNTHHVTIGSSLTVSNLPNFIQFNGQGGIRFSSLLGSPENNTIRKNHIKQNGTEGISIGSNCQDNILPPEIVQVTDIGTATFEVVGTHGRAGSVIDVYSGDLNQSATFEGLHWLGSGVVASDHIFQFFVDDCGCDLVVATATDPQGNTSEFSIGTLVMMTAVEDPKEDELSIRVYPNPFRQSTTIRFDLTQSDEIDLKVYTAEGSLLEILCHDRLQPGAHDRTWEAGSYPAGVYYYKLTSGSGQVFSGKLIAMQ